MENETQKLNRTEIQQLHKNKIATNENRNRNRNDIQEQK